MDLFISAIQRSSQSELYFSYCSWCSQGKNTEVVCHFPISKLGNQYIKAVYCYPAYLTSVQSISCEMLGWINHKLESRLQGKITTTSDMQMIPPLWKKAKKNWRVSWWRWKSEKAGLKLNIQKMKIMASDPITSWHIDGETIETVTDFTILGSKNHCRWWLQPWN